MKVGAALVTYNPDLERLEACLQSIKPQVDKLVLIDNSDQVDAQKKVFALCESSAVDIIQNKANLGVAEAQNLGLERLLDSSDWVVFCDDDTIFPIAYVDTMLKSVMAAQLNVTPDICGGVPAAKLTGAVTKASSCRSVKSPEIVKNLRSSGLMISAESARIVGPYSSPLFIDLVDYEWGWRAHARGKKVIRVTDCVIDHQLGEGALNLLGRRVGICASARVYYQVRNALWLLSLPWSRKFWLLGRLCFYPVRMTLVGLHQGDLHLRIPQFFRGLKDGLWQVRGFHRQHTAKH